MADGVDIDLYSDDIDQNFGQMKVRCIHFIKLNRFFPYFIRTINSFIDNGKFIFPSTNYSQSLWRSLA